MKLLRIATDYPHYLEQFYRQRPYLKHQSYAEQKKALEYDAFFWEGYWTVEFSKLGYDVQEIIWNCDTLQRQWAKEHLPKSKDHTYSLYDILLFQIIEFSPDIVWLWLWDIEFLKILKERFPRIKLIIGWVGSSVPGECLPFFLATDLLFSCAPESVERLSEYRNDVYHIDHWFVPNVLTRINNTIGPSHNIVFTGEIRLDSEHHIGRLTFLQDLIKQCKLEIYSPSVVRDTSRLEMYSPSVVKSTKALSLIRSVYYRFKHSPYRRIMNACRPGVFGLDMIQLLYSSRIGLNIHADSSPRFASNMKMFEISGSGSCLVTDWKKNINDLFSEDTEVVTYKSVEECIEKVKWLLDNPRRRVEIALAAQKRVEKQHRFDQRAAQMHNIIVSRLKGQLPS